jgi:hypothetical protein
MPRYIRTIVRKATYAYREVFTEVEETAERLKDEKNPKYGERYTFIAEGSDAALEKAPMLTGWEPYGAPEYEVVSAHRVEKPKNVDVVA